MTILTDNHKAPSVVRNYLYSLAYQVLVILTPLITTPYVTRVLGKDALGSYHWTQSICIYFTLSASLGIAMYGQREIAYVRDDAEKRYRIFMELFLLRLVTVAASLLPYILVFSVRGRYHTLFLIQGMELIAVAFDISWFLQGMENFRAVAGRNAAVKILSVVCIFLFIKKPEDIWLYALIQSGAVLLGNLSLWFYLPAYIGKKPAGRLRIRQHFVPVMLLFLPQIAIQIYNEMDKTMLGSLSPDIGETAYYTQAQKITKVASAVVKALGSVMLPRVSYIFSYQGEAEASLMIQKMCRVAVLMGSAMMCGIIGVAGNLVPWFLGDGFRVSETVLYLLAPTVLLISVSNVTGIQCLIPMKKQKEFNISVIAGALVNLCANAVLIPEHGAVGACIGTLLSECTVACIQLVFVRRLVLLRILLRETWRYPVLGVVMMGVLLFMNGKVPARPMITFLEVFLGCVLYGGGLLALRDPLTVLLKERILQRIKGGKK